MEYNQDGVGPEALGNKSRRKDIRTLLCYIVYALQM